MKQIAIFALAALFLWSPQARADAVKDATRMYIQGTTQLKAKQYSRAVRSFYRAYALLPRHPHFNCHRAQFLNYVAAAQTGLKRPYKAMWAYYRAAYRSGCKKASIRSFSNGHYRRMYRRWMCSVRFATSPPKARVYQVTAQGDKLLGQTPFYLELKPGSYQFKIRLYDHRTVYIKYRLTPGMHKRRSFTMRQGDDPWVVKERPDIAPPQSLSQLKKKKKPGKGQADSNRIVLPNYALPTDSAKGDTLCLRCPKVARPGPPIYKQAWFWAVVGGVVVAGIVIPIAIPKEQRVVLGKHRMFGAR